MSTVSSADMYGQIDVPRQKWKDAVGYIEPVFMDTAGRPMCPLCRAQSRQEELHKLDDVDVWACPRHHSFQATVLPE